MQPKWTIVLMIVAPIAGLLSVATIVKYIDVRRARLDRHRSNLYVAQGRYADHDLHCAPPCLQLVYFPVLVSK